MGLVLVIPAGPLRTQQSRSPSWGRTVTQSQLGGPMLCCANGFGNHGELHSFGLVGISVRVCLRTARSVVGEVAAAMALFLGCGAFSCDGP